MVQRMNRKLNKIKFWLVRRQLSWPAFSIRVKRILVKFYHINKEANAAVKALSSTDENDIIKL